MIFRVTAVVVAVDVTLGIILDYQAYVNDFMKPVICFTFMASVRDNWRNLLLDMRDSSVIIASVFMFVFCYSALGHFVFEYKLQGAEYFSSFAESFYQMFILLTTANFPNIMLPAYYDWYWNWVFFLLFLLLGLYFLVPMVLAHVYGAFKERISKEGINYHERIRVCLEDQINKFDSSINWERAVEDGQERRGRDYLRISELEGLFNELLGLSVKERRVDHMIYMRLCELMDVNEREDRV